MTDTKPVDDKQKRKQSPAEEAALKIWNLCASFDGQITSMIETVSLKSFIAIINTALTAERAEAAVTLGRLNLVSAFVLEVIRDTAFEGGDLDGCDVQDMGEKYGVLQPRTVTQEHLENHEVDDYLSEGDTAYFFPDWLLKGANRHNESQK